MARKKRRQQKATKSRRGAARRAPRPSHKKSPSGSPSSTVREDLLAFAAKLRANATEAEKYSASHIEKRLGKQATRNAETHFVTRTNHLAHELRARDSDFATLVARCLTPDPCRPIIDTLVSAGLQAFILTLASAVESIALRAGHVLDSEARRQLDEDLAHVLRLIASLVEVASWIKRHARAIGDEDMPTSARRVELPESLRSQVTASNAAAAAFIGFLADRPPAFGRGVGETTLAWLNHVRNEKERIETETQSLLRTLRVFTDADLGAAEAAGEVVLVQFLEKREEIVKEILAMRHTSILMTQSVIDRIIHWLSLHDDASDDDASDADDSDADGGGDEDASDDGLYAASRIIYTLNSVRTQLDVQKRLLEDVGQRVTVSRRAASVKQADLPAWEEISGTGKRTDTGVRAIWMLVLAFQDPDSAEQAFTSATANELLDRLNALSIARGKRFSDSWVFRALKKAEELKIVFRHLRADGQSKTTPDRYQLCTAAIRKYGGKFTAR